MAYDTEDSDDDSMIPDEELPNVVLITKVVILDAFIGFSYFNLN